jgi:oxaloacetate decarboxylase alpha subunit/pyruvate carboxylase subunit B
MLNVKFGRWKNLAQAAIDIALGKYGRTPGPIDGELLAMARKQSGQEPMASRPADLLAPRMPKVREELAARGLAVTDENAVLFAMFPRETEAFYKPAPSPATITPPPVALNGAARTLAEAAPATPAASIPRSSANRPNVSRIVLTLNERRYEAEIEELN